MSSNTDKVQISDDLQIPGRESGRRRFDDYREPPAGGRTEAQLRARVAELEAQLIEVARCLETAENTAARLRDELRGGERQIAAIKAMRTWRLTAPVRRVGYRARRLLGIRVPRP